MYAAIGKFVVRSGLFYVRRRYRGQLRAGAGIAAVAIGIAAYLATRNVPEG
jgi:hypothetical protein